MPVARSGVGIGGGEDEGGEGGEFAVVVVETEAEL